MKLQDNVYGEIHDVILRQYNSKTGVLKGNGVTDGTRKAEALKKEDAFELEHINDKLGIEKASEASNIDLERYKLVVQSYQQKMEKAERILNQRSNSGLAYEVSQLRKRLVRLEEDIDMEINGNNSSNGVEKL